ncbi:putative hydrolase [Stieleria maiorica]|uniref:Putative hydrolase n=1 Tax=Stieleria maiorica TaxID=2795974 RepID=A0A5B9MGZ6_9BACT|nr:alpha/beta fold hydrolase [Stieleria maiorica]QEF99250.1 putative hydrolase [Stieleria maiorica]
MNRRPSSLRLPDYKPFWPRATRPFLAGNTLGGMLQTVGNKFRPTPESALDRFDCTSIELPIRDGSGDILAGDFYRPDHPVADRPLVVLLHGLGGTSQSDYIVSAARLLCDEGNRVVCLDFRGCGDADPKSDGIHHPGRTGDLSALMRAVQRDDWAQGELDDGVVLVGFSLGGSVLLKFLAEEDIDRRVVGAITVSAPLDLRSTALNLSKPSVWPIQRYLLRRMKSEVLDGPADLTDDECAAIRQARSVWMFDETFTAPRCGFASVEEYYRENSAGPLLSEIDVPTLLIFAENDPVVSTNDYRQYDGKGNQKLHRAIVPDGGHVGFYAEQGSLPHATLRWHESCIASFLEQLTLNPNSSPDAGRTEKEMKHAKVERKRQAAIRTHQRK